MFIWNIIILKCCIFCSIWTLSKADQGIPLYILKSPFDPSTFSEEIVSCHGNCADDYYTCCFKNCDSNIQDIDNNAAEEQNQEVNIVENKPSFWSHFLYTFTFGYFGSAVNGENNMLKFLKTAEDTEGIHMFDDPTDACQNKCRSVFRKCYNKCVCDSHPDFPLCKPKVDVAVQDTQNTENIYHFDWNKVS